MTDRAKGCFVAFDHDIRVDDVECLVDAIKMLRGVAGVELDISDSKDWINRQQIRAELGEKLWNTINKVLQCEA